MKERHCIECKQCNRKGKPSVTKHSKYCDSYYKKQSKPTDDKLSFWTRIRDKYFEKRYDEKQDKMETKGFRPSWFWR
jgi:hypothetical protein